MHLVTCRIARRYFQLHLTQCCEAKIVQIVLFAWQYCSSLCLWLGCSAGPNCQLGLAPVASVLSTTQPARVAYCMDLRKPLAKNYPLS